MLTHHGTAPNGPGLVCLRHVPPLSTHPTLISGRLQARPPISTSIGPCTQTMLPNCHSPSATTIRSSNAYTRPNPGPHTTPQPAPHRAPVTHRLPGTAVRRHAGNGHSDSDRSNNLQASQKVAQRLGDSAACSLQVKVAVVAVLLLPPRARSPTACTDTTRASVHRADVPAVRVEVRVVVAVVAPAQGG